MDSTNKDDLLREKLRLLEADKKHRLNLPHKYGWKNYPWYNAFFETNNRTALLCAANQISKSSSQIRKVIALATEKEYWPKYFRQRPKLFWYLYPTATIATTEFRTKWVTDFLPRGEYKSHPDFGWREEFRNRGDIFAIHFNTGVSIYFKSYQQDESSLQASSVDYVACFTGSTPVLTEYGYQKIEDIKVGQLVLTREGTLQTVNKIFSREKKVIKRILSTGEMIEATEDHKFWVHGFGYKEFSELTATDILDTHHEWDAEKKKQSNILGINTVGIQTVKTEDTITFKARADRATNGSFIDFYGLKRLGQFLKDTLFTIKTRIHQTTTLAIWSAFQSLSTQGTTRDKSGPMEHLVMGIIKYVPGVKKDLLLEQLKKQQPYIAVKSVGDLARALTSIVLFAVKSRDKGPTRRSVFATSLALDLGVKKVHCLNVDKNHNFYVSGVSVSNCDEELPENLWDEINFRRNATDGLFSMVFTATLGQEFWRKAIEPKESEKEVMPDAWKMQVSMFDCRYYDDGTPSHWTTERIHRTIGMCKSEAEVQRRVYGKFIKDSGLKYQSFSRGINVVDSYDIPPDWVHYVGVDLGAGGEDNHPSAITFIAVAPNYQKGCVYKSWRGDTEQTTMTDVANKYLELKGYQQVAAAFYDYASKEFKLVTDRMGMSFLPADKGRETGEQVMNALFKNKMLDIFNIPENECLISEIMTLAIGIDKRKAKDDSVDSCRYAVTRIPWDWSYAERKIDVGAVVEKKRLTPVEVASVERERDRARMVANKFQEDINLDIDREISEWADYLDQSF